MRVHAISVALGLLAGCAAPAQLVLPERVPAQTSFEFQDARTPLSRTGSANGVGGRVSYGDGNLQPPPADLVRSWLYAALPNELRGKRVVLDGFDLGTRSTFASNPGVMPGTEALNYLLAPSVVFLRIDGSVDGRKFSVSISERADVGKGREVIDAVLARAKQDLVREVLRVAAAS